MGVRRTIVCLLFLLVLTGSVGGSYVWYLWTRTDEMLHGRIAAALRETVPDWNTSFSRARFDFQGQIRIYDFALKVNDHETPILNLPETVVSMDRDQLAAQHLVFQQVQLLQPQLELVRRLDGTWNWQGLGKLPQSEGNPPEWLISRGTIRIRVERPGDAGPALAVLRNANLQLTPSGKRRYLVKGDVFADPAGVIKIDGHWHMDDQSWQVDGRIDQFKFESNVWDQVCEFFPQLRGQMARLPEKLGFPLPGPPITDPQVKAVGDLLFRLRKTPQDPAIDYKLLMNVNSGQWSHPLCPYPLDDLQGKIYCDASKFKVPALLARHGNLQLTIRNAVVDRTHPDSKASALVLLKDLPLEERTRSRLNPYLRGIFDDLQPVGKIDLNMQLTYSKTDGLRVDSDLFPLGCMISHVKFPYPLKGVRGSIVKRGTHAVANLTGFAGQREVKIKGEAQTGGEHPNAVVDITVDELPLDEVFVSSAPEGASKTLRHMNLQGVANLHYRLTRDGLSDAPWQSQLRGELHSGSMTCKAFPYGINDFEGGLEFDGKIWKFTELKGTHGATELTGEGEYRMAPASGLLSLTIAAKGARFDQDLQMALPESCQTLWKEFTPAGGFDCVTQLDWVPGQVPVISLEADLLQTSIQLKSFPFPIEQIQGHVSFGRRQDDLNILRAELSDIQGRHDDTQMMLKGGYAEVEPNGEWCVRLDDFQVEDLVPNNRFRRALPTGFREVIETLDPREGTLALSGMLEFRGNDKPQAGVTSAWDLEILCTGTTVTTGVDLKHLYGKFTIKGTWDGQIINTSGWSDLSSLMILGYRFSNVRGPINITGNQLIIGNRDVVMTHRQTGESVRRPPQDQRITGRAIQGMFTLDGVAVLGKETSYTVILTMRDALLEKFAEEYLPGQHDLRGIMTGEAKLSGRGNSARTLKGGGQLKIQPAALYQLPVMLAVLKQLNGGSPNNTAFDEAQAFFEIDNSTFIFRQVDLKGAAVNLKGFGKVYFNRRLSFDFFSIVPRARAPLAILQQVVGQATVGMMGVEVRGTLDNPVAKIRPAQRLDEAFRNFLSGLDPRGQGAIPSAMPFGQSGRKMSPTENR